MRWFLLTFVTLLFASSGLRAAEPSTVALEFLRDLAKEKTLIGIPKELALSPFCGPEKKKVIEASWKRRASWLRRGKFDLSKGREEIKGDLAAVLLVAKSDLAPDQVSVVPLALKQHEGRWQIAPVEGKFDNANLGFAAETKSRSTALERWMATGRVDLAESIRAEELKRFRESMTGVVDPAKLKAEDPEDVLNYFLDAAKNGREKEIMVWLGVLERDELPEVQWKSILEITRRGMKNQDERNVWRLLTSPKVMKVVVQGNADDETASYLIGFLSSFEAGGLHGKTSPIRFSLTMTKGGWRIELPPFFSQADEAQTVHWRAHNAGSDWEDRQLVKEMGLIFEDENEQLPADNPAAMMEEIAADLKKGHLESFLQRHFRESEQEEADDDGEDAENDDEEEKPMDPALANVLPQFGGFANAARINDRRIKRYEEAVRWWDLTLGDQDRMEVVIEKIYQAEKVALGIIRVPHETSAKPVFRHVWMTMDDDEWVIAPGSVEPMRESIHPDLVFEARKLARQQTAAAAEMKEAALKNLLAHLAILNVNGTAPKSEDAVELVKKWRMTLKKESLDALFKKSALVKMPKKPSLFVKDVTALRSGARAAIDPDQVLGSAIEGRLAGVSLLIDDGLGKSYSCPLVLVVPTKEGPRVLADVEFSLETNKAKRLRNEAVLDELEKKMAPTDLISLKKLLEWHNTTARSAWDARESKVESK